MLPPLVLAVSLLSFYVAVGLQARACSTVILSHLLFTLPFVIIVVYARMASLRLARGRERARPRRLAAARPSAP